LLLHHPFTSHHIMAQSAELKLDNETTSSDTSEFEINFDDMIAELEINVDEHFEDEDMIETAFPVLGVCTVMVLGHPSPAPTLAKDVLGIFSGLKETVKQHNFPINDSAPADLSAKIAQVPATENIYFLVHAHNVTMVRRDDGLYLLFALNDYDTSATPKARMRDSFFKCTTVAETFLEAEAEDEKAHVIELTSTINRGTQSHPLVDDTGAEDERKESETKPAIKDEDEDLIDDLKRKVQQVEFENQMLTLDVERLTQKIVWQTTRIASLSEKNHLRSREFLASFNSRRIMEARHRSAVRRLTQEFLQVKQDREKRR